MTLIRSLKRAPGTLIPAFRHESPLVTELLTARLPRRMAGYLVLDYRFLDTFLALIGGAIANRRHSLWALAVGAVCW